MSDPTVECGDCGALVSIQGDTPEHRIPCGACGSVKRKYSLTISTTVAVRPGMGAKAKRAGEKRPFIENVAVPDYSRDRGKAVHKDRVIDRDNDRYCEKITDYESGDVIHQCEEPLSEHQRHGSAKSKKDASDS